MKKLFWCISILLLVFGLSATAIAIPYTEVGGTADLVAGSITFQPQQDSDFNVNWLASNAPLGNGPFPIPLTFFDKVEFEEPAPTNGKEISHYSLWTTGTPIPEPATMLLLGVGLVGLAGFGRKKLLKKK